MSPRDDALGRLLRYSFAGPGETVLPQSAVHGMAARISRDWVRYAACQGCDGDAWFPDVHSKPNALVERICGDCPVATACLATAVLGDEEGIWGGTRRGQRLHARARLFNYDPVDQVLADLLASPLPATEYGLPDPTEAAKPVDTYMQPQLPYGEPDGVTTAEETQRWREAS